MRDPTEIREEMRRLLEAYNYNPYPGLEGAFSRVELSDRVWAVRDFEPNS